MDRYRSHVRLAPIEEGLVDGDCLELGDRTLGVLHFARTSKCLILVAREGIERPTRGL